MELSIFLIAVSFGLSNSQFFGGSLFSVPWSQGDIMYGKPIRPSPFGYGGPMGSGQASGGGTSFYSDDAAAVMPSSNNHAIDAVFSPHQLPSKLPIRAPNAVVEIYNRVVDDFARILATDFKNANIDPMNVVIRPTPPGPVRVPGHLQKRPFRRPGAALYRSHLMRSQGRTSSGGQISINNDEYNSKAKSALKTSDSKTKNTKATTDTKNSKSEAEDDGFDYYMSFEDILEQRSGEAQHDYEGHQGIQKVKLDAKVSQAQKKKIQPNLEEDEVDAAEAQRDVETLLRQYQRKNVPEGKLKYTATKKETSQVNAENGSKRKPDLEEDSEDDPPEQEDEDEDIQDDSYDREPGTLQSGGDRPLGGYYPLEGGPAIPAKSNAQLVGLGRMRRTSDVSVGVDARSATVTARLLMGPLVVQINDSTEPLEIGIKGTVPGLEAEIQLMERHGVVFLQRFTLDRVYGQDIEISIPKIRRSGSKNPKKKINKGVSSQHPMDPMHPAAMERFQSKMAAHISMEMVKLLRTGSLRVEIMRIAQESLNKLKIPLKSVPSGRKGSRKRNKAKQQEPRGESRQYNHRRQHKKTIRRHDRKL